MLPPLVTRAHAELARQHGAGTICTIPLESDGKFFGGLTLERPADRAFDQDTVELCETVAALIGPILDAKRKEERWLITKAGESFTDAIEKALRAWASGRQDGCYWCGRACHLLCVR